MMLNRLHAVINRTSSLFQNQVRNATKMASGTAKNGRDSNPQYLGVKLYGGQIAKPGAIIIRQRGTKAHPGENVKMGKDHTIYSIKHGQVQFFYCPLRKRQIISVLPHGADLQAFRDRMRPRTIQEHENIRHKILAMKEIKFRERTSRERDLKRIALFEKYPYIKEYMKETPIVNAEGESSKPKKEKKKAKKNDIVAPTEKESKREAKKNKKKENKS